MDLITNRKQINSPSLFCFSHHFKLCVQSSLSLQCEMEEKLPGVSTTYLQVDLDDFIKLLLLHAEQEVVLSDAGCIHAHRGRLEVPSLQEEDELHVKGGGEDEHAAGALFSPASSLPAS